MRRLYSAKVARPFSSVNTRPTRLGFTTTAWCHHEDLIAVISGCGAVAVFHADAPGEVAVLVGNKRAPARHVVWRNSPDKPIMLAVADASGRITFWVARDKRVNIWGVADVVEVPSVILSLGWNGGATALAAVLAQGTLAVWRVPDLPVNTRASHRNRQDVHNRAQPNVSSQTIRELTCKQTDLQHRFGGQLRCAAVAPGGVHPLQVAVVTVSAVHPCRLNVWQVSIPEDPEMEFDVSALSPTSIYFQDAGTCVACAVVPSSGILFTVGERGVIARWHRKHAAPGVEGGWQMQAQACIDQETEDAISRGVLPRMNRPIPTDATTRGLEAAKRRRVYAFEVSADCKSMVTSTSAGLLVWETENLKITNGQSIEVLNTSGTDVSSPYWGLCVSRECAAVFALTGRGSVDAFSLTNPILAPNPDSMARVASIVAGGLIKTAVSTGLRGGWDYLASMAQEGPDAARQVAKALSSGNLRTPQNGPMIAPRIANAKAAVMRMVSAEDGGATAANRLLDVAIDAIRESSSESVKTKLMLNTAENKKLSSAANVGKVIRQVLSTRPTPSNFAASPLADWIMLLGAVWLQRCVSVVVKHDPQAQKIGPSWATVLSLMQPNELCSNPGRGMVYDTALIRRLPAAVLAAVCVLAQEEEYGQAEAIPRYFRFSREEAAQVAATIWEVALAWDSQASMSRTLAGTTGLGSFGPGGSTEQVSNAAAAYGKHQLAGSAISNAKKLRVDLAEKALGLYGAAQGAGFVLSYTRKNHGLDGSSYQSSNPSGRVQGELRAEWCPFDIVTGRPLPPWAPLRRCVITGLLAAEITQQKSNIPAASNLTSPWISRWADHSPFGGRWARVPSLDLERFELLPAVPQHTPEKIENATGTGRPPKAEEVLANQANYQALQASGLSQSNPSFQFVPNGSTNGQVSAGMTGTTSADGGVASAHANHISPQVAMAGNRKMTYPTTAAAAAAAAAGLPNGMGGFPHTSGGLRVQASPGMSTASSTTDQGSTTSKGKKRKNSGPKGHSRKNKGAAEPRTPTASQLSDFAGANLGFGGLPNMQSPASMNPSARNADALSTDTRSTNTNGGVDQDTSKPTRRRKRPTKAKDASGSAAAAAAAAAAEVAAQVANINGPHGQPNLAQNINQLRSNNSKRPKTTNDTTAAAAAAAAAAAEAAAASAPASSKQIPRNTGINHNLQPQHNLVGMGVPKPEDQLGHGGLIGRGQLTNSGNIEMNVQLGVNQLPSENKRSSVAGTTAGVPLNVIGGIGLENQNEVDVGGMNRLHRQNNGTGQQGTTGQSLANLAMQLGLPQSQLNNLARERGQEALEALSRRFALQTAAGTGPNRPGTVPPGTNLLNTTPLQNIQLSNSNNNEIKSSGTAGMGRIVGAGVPTQMGQLQLGANGAQSQALSNNTGSIGNLGAQLPEGVTSVPGPASPTSSRTNVPRGNNGMSVAPPTIPVSTNTSVGAEPVGATVTNGNQEDGTRPGPGSGPNPTDGSGNQVWRGHLRVCGEHRDMMVECIAIQYTLADKAPIQGASSWPKHLRCDSSRLKSSTQVLHQMSAPSAQWYVRFAPVDADGVERTDPRLYQLVMVMVAQKLAFEIQCDGYGGTAGTLYLWGMPIPPHGHSLLGVFHPGDY